jgi:hypothetical protein
MNPYAARALGAVAAVLAITAIWVEFAPDGTTYWDGAGHATGIAMLVLAILTGAGIVLASLTQMRAFDQIWLVPGLVLGGLDLLIPLEALGAGNIGDLQTGGWLGLVACGLFVAAGIVNALLAPAPDAIPAPVATTTEPATAALSLPTGQAESKPAPEASGPPSGWYPDPTGEARLRYWDGKDWTENTSA